MPIAFVTGGARRIGKHLALGFAEKGYDVGITYNESHQQALKTVAELHAYGVRAEARQCNVSDDNQLANCLRELSSSLGVPDVMISNAGVFPQRKSIDTLSVDEFRETMAVNATPLLTIAKVFRELRSHKPDSDVGKLISISSIGALEIWKDRIDYNVSKSTLVALVRGLARALAPTISVNTVAPGAIKIVDESTEAERSLSPVDRIPFARYGEPRDVFDAVWFFATCTPYITGQLIAVDGGYGLTR